MSLRPLLEIAAENERLAALRTELAALDRTVEAYVSAALRPYLLAALIESGDGVDARPVVIVTADDRSARDLAGDLNAYLAPRRVHFYPSRGTAYESHIAPPPHLAGLRVDALRALATSEPIVVASAIALAEAVPDLELWPEGVALHQGESVDLTDVAVLLADGGYERVDQVEERGQFAIRGGILDVYPATEERAVRVELFGDEIESLRWFSIFTQRSLGDAKRVDLAPAAELAAEHREGADEVLERFRAPLDLVPETALVAIAASEEIPGALRDHWEDATTAMHADDARRFYVDLAEPLRARAGLELSASDAGQGHVFRAQSADFPSRTLAEAEGELEKLVRSGYRVVVAFEGRGEAERVRYNLSRLDVPFLGDQSPEEPGVSFAEARLRDGFMAPELKLAVIPQRRLLHRRPAAVAVSARARLAAAIELRVGDASTPRTWRA
jgi:transcription-repair coupling factor (superfamily II helicase)